MLKRACLTTNCMTSPSPYLCFHRQRSIRDLDTGIGALSHAISPHAGRPARDRKRKKQRHPLHAEPLAVSPSFVASAITLLEVLRAKPELIASFYEELQLLLVSLLGAQASSKAGEKVVDDDDDDEPQEEEKKGEEDDEDEEEEAYEMSADLKLAKVGSGRETRGVSSWTLGPVAAVVRGMQAIATRSALYTYIYIHIYNPCFALLSDSVPDLPRIRSLHAPVRRRLGRHLYRRAVHQRKPRRQRC